MNMNTAVTKLVKSAVASAALALIAQGLIVEPRNAALFGLNDDSPDAVVSFNLEYKIGQP